MKRWIGDKVNPYKYVEKTRQKLKAKDFQKGTLSLPKGIYQLKHNSVSGTRGMTSGYYGESNFFEIKSGDEFIEVEVFLYPAI